MKIIAIIPARMAASRFPGKPLAPILGLPMIEHVRRRVALCEELDEVVVATCDEEIQRVVEKAGGKVIMTSHRYERCTDRIAEAARSLNADVFVNVQGDEPLVLPWMIEEAFKPFLADFDLPAVNLVARIISAEEFNDPNIPKVVTSRFGDILYISREPIPSQKRLTSEDSLRLKQLGIIAFRGDFLQCFSQLAPAPLEKAESVDMMRAIEHGYRVRAVEIKGEMISVDRTEDIRRVEDALSKDLLVGSYL